MAEIVNGYTTLADVRARIGREADNVAKDSALNQAINAASRWIDRYCGRRFYRATETRYFTAEWGDILYVDDLASVTTLKTDEDGDRTYERTWAATDYDLEPFNAVADGQPYTAIRVTPNGRYGFPTTRKGVEIAGSFGYASTAPDAVVEACLILATRFWKRRETPFGISGSPETGVVEIISRVDPDVETLLAPYRRLAVWGV